MSAGFELPYFGIAVSGYQIQYVDPRELTGEFPGLPWKTAKRTWAKTRKTWFDYVTLEHKVQQGSPIKQGIETWAMNYRFLSLRPEWHKIQRASIERFTSLELSIGQDFEKQVRFHTQWLPGSRSFNKKGARLEIPDRDGGTFEVRIKWRGKDAPATFVSLEAMRCPLVTAKAVRTDHFKLDIGKNKLVLKGIKQ